MACSGVKPWSMEGLSKADAVGWSCHSCGRSVTGLYWKREPPAMAARGLDALKPQNGWAESRTEAFSSLRAAAVSLPLAWPGFGGSMGPPPLCTRVVPLAERVALRVHGTPLLFLPVFMPTAQKMSLVASGKGKLRPRERVLRGCDPSCLPPLIPCSLLGPALNQVPSTQEKWAILSTSSLAGLTSLQKIPNLGVGRQRPPSAC